MVPEVRLSGVENEPLGVVSINEALRMAGELDVDLVEIAATATPPGLSFDGLRQVQVPRAEESR
jgi:translation initiation factor IF-3